MTILESARKGLAGFNWFFKGIMGEDAYEKYKAHHQTLPPATDASHPLMTEREFWRDKTDRQENNPQGRCC
ncbi:YbdD/YjiX family protein [Arthrobacter sp. NQ7]|uniref:YbdD/YjiX family protein n=1 Tax=Arthrobacter sp. NQ7 TaxID=3032303 RepID=UPI00240F288C|nr:YbdD/YjiX family protein [Arthrobacter sp. NQ7]MDJ0458043.1 YbdD/YjiX family protein [Arthrobacter sp. NQ7]